MGATFNPKSWTYNAISPNAAQQFRNTLNETTANVYIALNEMTFKTPGSATNDGGYIGVAYNDIQTRIDELGASGVTYTASIDTTGWSTVNSTTGYKSKVFSLVCPSGSKAVDSSTRLLACLNTDGLSSSTIEAKQTEWDKVKKIGIAESANNKITVYINGDVNISQSFNIKLPKIL